MEKIIFILKAIIFYCSVIWISLFACIANMYEDTITFWVGLIGSITFGMLSYGILTEDDFRRLIPFFGKDDHEGIFPN